MSNRGDVNLIQAPGVVVDPKKERVLQPRIGQDVQAKDMFLGRVDKVIINPRNRRVTAFVVHGNFPDPKQMDPDTLPGDEPRVERRVVIPTDVVKTVTIAGIWLSITGIDAAKYSDLNPNELNAPDENWQPPYPYSRADVLLDRARVATAREPPGVVDSTRPRNHA